MSFTPQVQTSRLVFKQAAPVIGSLQAMALAGGKGWGCTAWSTAAIRSLAWIISAALSRGGLDKFLDTLLYNYRNSTERQ